MWRRLRPDSSGRGSRRVSTLQAEACATGVAHAFSTRSGGRGLLIPQRGHGVDSGRARRRGVTSQNRGRRPAAQSITRLPAVVALESQTETTRDSESRPRHPVRCSVRGSQRADFAQHHPGTIRRRSAPKANARDFPGAPRHGIRHGAVQTDARNAQRQVAKTVPSWRRCAPGVMVWIIWRDCVLRLEMGQARFGLVTIRDGAGESEWSPACAARTH